MNDEQPKRPFREVLADSQARLAEVIGTKDQRKIKRLEKDLEDLNKLFVETDQELRKMIKDIKITGISSVCAVEFTLANRMGITIDVVMAYLTPKDRRDAEEEIERRVAQCPGMIETARLLAIKQYKKEGDDY